MLGQATGRQSAALQSQVWVDSATWSFQFHRLLSRWLHSGILRCIPNELEHNPTSPLNLCKQSGNQRIEKLQFFALENTLPLRTAGLWDVFSEFSSLSSRVLSQCGQLHGVFRSFTLFAPGTGMKARHPHARRHCRGVADVPAKRRFDPHGV